MMAFCACWIPTFPIAFHVSVTAWIVVAIVATGLVFAFGGLALWSYFVWLRATPRWAQIRFLWALATALEAGLYLDEAFSLAAEVTAPSKLSERLGHLDPKGQPITDTLRSSRVFDEGVLTMISSGEMAGSLPTSLRKAASYLEEGTL